LSKLTRYAATAFMITSMVLAILATRGTGGPGTTVLEELPARGSQPVHSAPALPGPGSAPLSVQVPGPGGKPMVIPVRPSQPVQKLPPVPVQPAPAAPAQK
jgi:hypothetical protein